MNKILFLTFISILLSCNPERGSGDYSKSDSLQDSILYHYNISTKDSLSIEKRKTAIDKSLVLAKTCGICPIYSKVLYQKNLISFSLKEYDSLQFFNDLLVNNASEVGDNDILGRQSYFMAYYYDEIARLPDSAFRYYTLSNNYFQHTKNDYWIGISLLRMGIIQQDQNDYFGSKETITEALKYLNIIQDSIYISSAWNELATNHRKLFNYEDGIKYFSKAIETSNSEKDKLTYKNNLAATYIDNQEFTKAILLLKSILKDSLLINNQKEYVRVLDNLTYSKWLSGVAINEEQFQEPLEIRVQNKDQRGQIASYTHLGEYNSKTSPKRAKAFFDSVIQLSKKTRIPRAEKDALKFLMQLQPQNVTIRDRYVLLQDSLYTQELKVKTQFAKYKYDDKSKQEEILRLGKENVEKKLETTQQRTQKIISFAVGALLLLSLGFAIYYFVQRAKRLKQEGEREKQKEVYANEAKLSRRVHDDFGGKLNHAIILLQNDAPKPKVLDVLGNAYDQSRDFSREINDVDTGPNFKSVLFTMLSSYSKNITLAITGSTTLEWETISEFTKKTIFKVLQELMTNMQRHSKATLVSIAFERTKKKLKIEYSDDGIGASKDSLNTKNGLLNTEKRIQAINGSITFDSEKNKGFKALIELPI